ncbi:MAG: hypothetical protein HOW73_29160 [Polyangiaceae bacterium]|nr:hypothetical protein [Polyangiaceae bacterium]
MKPHRPTKHLGSEPLSTILQRWMHSLYLEGHTVRSTTLELERIAVARGASEAEARVSVAVVMQRWPAPKTAA